MISPIYHEVVGPRPLALLNWACRQRSVAYIIGPSTLHHVHSNWIHAAIISTFLVVYIMCELVQI